MESAPNTLAATPGTRITVEIDDVITPAQTPFAERHSRRVELPIDEVWSAALTLRAAEIRTLGPLMSLRYLPDRVLARTGAGRSTDREAVSDAADRSFLDEFTDEGFVIIRRDPHPIDGRGLVVFGAVGKFWKPVGNQPVSFEDPVDLADFDEAGHAVIVATIEAVDRGDFTELVTETRVRGTDRGSTLKFAPYWAIIRLPSGLIRRCWLAAIERRARRMGATR